MRNGGQTQMEKLRRVLLQRENERKMGSDRDATVSNISVANVSLCVEILGE